MVVIEAPIDLLVVDERRFPDRDGSAVLDHLVRYHAHSAQLPAVEATLEHGQLLLSRRHKYVEVARRLGRPAIRMVVRGANTDTDTDADAFARLVARPDIIELDWTEIDRQERAQPETDLWHVFFFECPLDPDTVERFRADIVDRFFPAGAREWTVEPGAGLVEFVALTAPEDHMWASGLLGALRAFHAEHARIATYQGTKFA